MKEDTSVYCRAKEGGQRGNRGGENVTFIGKKGRVLRAE